MSARKFKVGDRVRVRYDMANTKDTCRGGIYIARTMGEMVGTVLTIKKVCQDCYRVTENKWVWSDQMLEPVEKTLNNLCAGDFIKSGSSIRKILAAVDGCYLLSYIGEYTATGAWCTVNELEEAGYSFIESDAPELTVEINGKKYKKTDVEKAIKDLEVVE